MRACSNACYKCDCVGHFKKDCSYRQDDDTSTPVIRQMQSYIISKFSHYRYCVVINCKGIINAIVAKKLIKKTTGSSVIVTVTALKSPTTIATPKMATHAVPKIVVSV